MATLDKRNQTNKALLEQVAFRRTSEAPPPFLAEDETKYRGEIADIKARTFTEADADGIRAIYADLLERRAAECEEAFQREKAHHDGQLSKAEETLIPELRGKCEVFHGIAFMRSQKDDKETTLGLVAAISRACHLHKQIEGKTNKVAQLKLDIEGLTKKFNVEDADLTASLEKTQKEFDAFVVKSQAATKNEPVEIKALYDVTTTMSDSADAQANQNLIQEILPSACDTLA